MAIRQAVSTSMARPHAAGVAALALSVTPGLQPAALASFLERTADPLPTPEALGSSDAPDVAGTAATRGVPGALRVLADRARRLHAASGSQLDPSIVETLVSVLDDAGVAIRRRIPDAA